MSEIKASSLANKVEPSRIETVRRMLDETDFEARLKIKKPEWFLQPDETVTSRKLMSMRRKLRKSHRASHPSESPSPVLEQEERTPPPIKRQSSNSVAFHAVPQTWIAPEMVGLFSGRKKNSDFNVNRRSNDSPPPEPKQRMSVQPIKEGLIEMSKSFEEVVGKAEQS